MEIFLLRHSETISNKCGILSGQTEVGLTKKGEKDSDDIIKNLSQISWDSILSSPLKRTKIISDAISKNQKLELEEYDWLKEIDFGEFEGKTYSQIAEKYPLEYEKMKLEKMNYSFPKGESQIQMHERIIENFLKWVLENKLKKRVLIVTHAGVIRSILAEFIAKNPNLHWNFLVETASFSILDFKEDFWMLKSLNQKMIL